MSERLTVRKIVSDPAIKVSYTEDLNIENHVKRLVLKALNKHQGNQSMACRDLGVTERTIYDLRNRFIIVFDTQTSRYVCMLDMLSDPADKIRFLGTARHAKQVFEKRKRAEAKKFKVL